MNPTYIVIGVVLFFVFLFIFLYNRIVKLRNNRKNAFADIDVQLKQRHDLIPQLVETVKGYAGHEKELLTKVTEARSGAMKATSINDKIASENQLTASLRSFNIAVEAYPDLKANQNFLQLQEELADIENKLAAVRRYFNAATTEYNNSVETFPANIIAGMFSFKKEPFFDLGEDQRKQLDQAPKIQF